MSCRGGNGRSTRHHNPNDLVWQAMAKADIPALKEPSGLLRTDGERPDSVTLLPWKRGKCTTWDVTVSNTLAQSYILESRDIPDTRRHSRGGSRKEKKQVLLTKPIVLVCSNHGRNRESTRTRWTFCANLEGTHTKYR